MERLLRNYRHNLSKIRMYEVEEAKLQNELKELSDISYISAGIISDMPRSVTNKFNSLVENIVCEREANNDHKRNIYEKMHQIWKDKQPYVYEKDKADAALEALGLEERFIVTMFYIEDLNWRMVAGQYHKEFNTYIDESTLKRKRRWAISKLKGDTKYIQKCPENAPILHRSSP